MIPPKIEKVLVAIVLIAGLLPRLYHLGQPVADWHSHRQADTASVTQHFIKQGINLLKPTYHDLSDVQSGFNNPQGLRFVEFPIYNLISSLTYQITGRLNFPIDSTSRLVSIAFSLASSVLIFYFTRDLAGRFLPALLAQAIFLFLPYNIYFSRTILPEPTAVFFMLLSLFLFKRHPFLSAISLALSILIKPYTAIILLPVLFIYHRHRPPVYLFFTAVTLIPLVLWRLWMRQFPQGIPASTWLFNTQGAPFLPEWSHGINLSWLNHLVAFRPHWFHWLFLDRISGLILGSYGLIALFLGLLYRYRQSQITVFSFLVGIFLYFVTIAQGNIQHDYYQVLIIPFLSIISGIGYYYLLRFAFRSPLLALLSAAGIFALSTFFSWERIKTYYTINNPKIILAGQEADRILPPNALVIAPYVGDTAFLYQTQRSGWPTEIYDLETAKREHPNNPIYLVSVNYDSYTNSYVARFPTITKNNDYVILDLNQSHEN